MSIIYSSSVQNALNTLSTETTIDGLTALVKSLSANAYTKNAILYTGTLSNNVSSHTVAVSAANQTGWAIIDNTDRGVFLSITAQGQVGQPLVSQQAINIYIEDG